MDADKNVTAIFTQQLLEIWDASLTVSNSGQSQLLYFGKQTGATDGLDNNLQEAELPPVPPTGTFDVRFNFPGNSIASLRDYRSDAETYIKWKITFQPGSGDYPIEFSWDNNYLAQCLGEFTLKDAVNGSLVNINMKNQNSFTLNNSALNSLIIEQYTESQSLDCININVNAGWNLVSIPYKSEYMNVNSLFPDASSSAFGFDNGYVNTAEFENGKGYWLKFDNPETVQICGTMVSQNISVKAGWNIIGPFSQQIQTSQINSSSVGNIISDYFGFSSGIFQLRF